MPMQVRLIIVGGKADRAELAIMLPSVVGRDPKSGLSIAHPMISHRHCEIFEVDGLVMIRDLDSLNGTLLAGRRVKQSPLPPEAEFTLGPLTFRVEYFYQGDLGKLPQPVFLEPAAASSVTAEPEVPDLEAVEEPAPVVAPSVGGDQDQTESDEIFFDDIFGESAATSEVDELAETKGDERTEEDQRIDFLRTLEEEAVAEEAVESKESELEEVEPDLPPEPVVLEKIAEKPLAEVQPEELVADEAAMEFEPIEESPTQESEAEVEIAEELKDIFHLTETPPVEPVAAEEPEIEFDTIEVPMAEAEPTEPAAAEEPEAELEVAEEPEAIPDFFEELATEVPTVEPVVDEEPELTFEPIEESATEPEPIEPAVEEEPEADLEVAEESESVFNRVEEPDEETTSTESTVIEEPAMAEEPEVDVGSLEEPDVEADIPEPAVAQEPDDEYETTEESQEAFYPQEETETETDEPPTADSHANGGTTIDTSTAMSRLSARKRKHQQSWFGGLLGDIKEKRAERTAKREANAAKALSREKIPSVEPSEVEEPPVDEEVYFSEEEEEPTDESAENPVQPPADPVGDLLKDFMT